VSGQTESRHYFRVRDRVRHLNGDLGTVVERFSLYATVLWADGRREEVDQFDPLVVVVERAESE
jgi:hypothetical protein